MQNRFLRFITSLLLTLATAATVFLLLANRQNILDWYDLQNYKPPADIAAIADKTTMAGRGRDMFYVSQPAVEKAGIFNTNCSNGSEKSIVLGCYKLWRIHLYDVTDPRLNGVIEVTAAHEMLHAAYMRLDASTKNKVDALLQTEMKNAKDEHLVELIDIYNREEPGQLLNEMHSILGTEYGNLSPELESYYKQYFTDRSKVVSMAQAYEAVFNASKDKIKALTAQMTDLKTKIDANNSELSAQDKSLQQQSADLANLRRTNVSAYNAAVPGYNREVNTFNALINQTKELVNTYNQLVVQYNNESTAQQGLYQSLNSNYQPVQ